MSPDGSPVLWPVWWLFINDAVCVGENSMTKAKILSNYSTYIYETPLRHL